MRTKPTDNTSIYLGCSCGDPYCALFLDVDFDWDDNALSLATVINRPDGFRRRLRHAWDILRGSEYVHSEVILTREQAAGLGVGIIRALDDGDGLKTAVIVGGETYEIRGQA